MRVELVSREEALERIEESVAAKTTDPMSNKLARTYVHGTRAVFEVAFTEGSMPLGAILNDRAIVRMERDQCWFAGEDEGKCGHNYIFTQDSIEAGLERKVIIFVN